VWWDEWRREKPMTFARSLALMVVATALVTSQALGQQVSEKRPQIGVVVIETVGSAQPPTGALSPTREVYMSTPKVTFVDTDKLAAGFRAFVEQMSKAIQSAPSTIGPYSMGEIELHAQVTAEGGVNLIGMTTVGVTGGIIVKLRREPTASVSERLR
jgi:hypothetical protein